MPKFNSYAELAKYIQAQYIDKVLEVEVAETIKDVEAAMVKEDVYDAYVPPTGKTYVPRRNGNDGLMDKKNMKVLVLKGVLIVKNEAQGTPSPPVTYTTGTDEYGGLAPIIEYGRPTGAGLYTTNNSGDPSQPNTSWGYLQPRPFTQDTINHLRITNAHKKALKAGLIARGLKVQE